MKLSNIAAGLALLACSAAPVSVAAQSVNPCITKDQLGGLVVALMPAAIKQLKASCGTNLPSGASLNKITPAQMKMFETASESAKPKAGEALRIMMGKDVPEGVDPSSLMPFIESMAVSGIASELKPDTCPMVNNLWSALAPLPPENWGELVATFAQLGMSGNKKTGKVEGKKSPMSDLNICPYVAEGAVARL